MSNEPTPAPADLADFDDWARQAADSWQRALVHEEVARRWVDASLTPDEQALLAVWGSTVGIPPVSKLREIGSDPAVSEELRARVKAATAQAIADSDLEGATALAEEVLPVADDAAIDTRTRLSLWLAASEMYARAGRPGDAMGVLNGAGQALKDDPDAPRWALLVIDAERVGIAARAGQNREQIAQSAHQIALAARQLPATRTSVDVAVKAAGILLGMGAVKPAEEHFEAILDLTEGIAGARGPRYQAQAGLAEARLRIEGPEAAMEVQREAIATVEPLGDTPMLVWARRGLAAQLAAADRFEEAAAAYAEAAEVNVRLGSVADAAALRIEQAGALIQAGETDEATALAESVAEEVAEIEDPVRTSLEMGLHHVFAQLASFEGDLASAAEHWVEVAERSAEVGASPLEPYITAAQLYASAEDLDAAAVQFSRAELAAADAPDPAAAIAMVMSAHADALRQAGRPEDAAEMARVASNHSRSSGDEAQAIFLSVVAADSLHEAGDSQAALQLYADTIEAAKEAEMPSLLGAVYAAQAKVLRNLGRDAEAAEAEASAAALSRSAGVSEKLQG